MTLTEPAAPGVKPIVSFPVVPPTARFDPCGWATARFSKSVSLLPVAPSRSLAGFVAEVLPGTGLSPEAFWSGFAAIVRDLGPRNRALLAERDRLQSAIDRWHRDRRGKRTM